MNKEQLKKFFLEDNLIILLGGVIITLFLLVFLIYGISEPSTTYLEETPSISQLQEQYETDFLVEYEAGSYSSHNPYFILDPYDMAPLSGLIMFSTDEVKSFKLVILGKAGGADMEVLTVPGTTHYIPVYGLYAGHYNTIKLFEITEDEEILNATVNIVTEPLPDNILEPTVMDTTFDYFGNDLMLLMPAVGSLPVAYDYEGEVRWYLSTNLTWAPTMLENGHLLLGTDRLLSAPYYTTGLYEIDFLGKIYREYMLPGGYHHDVYEMSNGNFLIGTNDFDSTVEDIIVEVERNTGEIIKTWDVADYLPMLEGMAEMWTTFDWFHNNSIYYDETTDSIILSGRHQDAVISIGYTTNKLNWIIGDPTNWDSLIVDEYFFMPLGNVEWSYAQHSAKVLENGDIFIFDNGNNRSKLREDDILAEDNYSRGVIYRTNSISNTIEQVYQFGKELGSDFYSPYISNVDYYSEGNYLIHSGGIATVNSEVLNIPAPLSENFLDAVLNSITIEVLDGNVAYRLEVPSHFYRAKRISIYTDYSSFSFGQVITLGNFNKTPTTDEEFNKRYNFFVTVPAEYELNLTKEEDRLTINAVFNKNEVVYVVLDNSFGRLVYSVPTGSNTYTAMCTVVSDGDSRFISYYINEEEMSGTYQVFIYIDGKEYNTYQKVIFK